MPRSQATIKTSQNQQKQQSQYANGKWSKSEHTRFLRAIAEFGKNWNEIQKLIKTRNLSQVRSHAQKHFAKVKQEQDESCQMSLYSSQEDLIQEQKKSSTIKREPETEKIKLETEINLPNEKQGGFLQKRQLKENIVGIFKQTIQQQTLQIDNGNQYLYNEHEKVEKMNLEHERFFNEQRLFYFQGFQGQWAIFYLL